MASKAIVRMCQVAVEVLDAKIPDLIPGPMDEGMPEELTTLILQFLLLQECILLK